MADEMVWKNRITGYGTKKASQFTAHPLNHRRHPQRQRSAVHGSLTSLGWIDVVLENKTTGHVIDGHERIWQALKNGDAEVPYIEVELSEAEEAQALLSLDAIAALAETDKDNVAALLAQVQTDNADVMQFLTDFAAENKLDWNQPEAGDAEPQVDRAAELLEKWQVKSGDLWRIGDHRLLCGDSTKREDVERVMGGEKAGMVFIDPPYMTFGSSTGKLEAEDFNMLAPFWEIVTRTAQSNLEDGRAAFICCDWRSYPTLCTQAFKHLTVKNLIVWDFGGAMKLGTGNFRTSYELLVYAVNTKFGRSWLEKQTGTWKVEDRSERDLWTIKQNEAAPGKGREHVSQKPVELVERALKNGSNDGDILFDYFAGSGTTLVACENLGRKCRAIEISPAYCAVILERMSQAFPGIEIARIDA